MNLVKSKLKYEEKERQERRRKQGGRMYSSRYSITTKEKENKEESEEEEEEEDKDLKNEFETIKKNITHAIQITGLATAINIVPQTSKKIV